MAKLIWLKTLAEATAAAKAQEKKILLIGGRENCSQTTWTRDNACEYSDPPVRQLIDKYLIPWYCDVDSCFEGERYLQGTGSYDFPNLAVIDPADTSKAIKQRTKPISVPALYDWLKTALQVPDPVVPPVPPSIELDLGKMMEEFREGYTNLIMGDHPVPWCGGKLWKTPPTAFGGASTNWKDDTTGKMVSKLQTFTIADVMEKLYKPFPSVKKVFDAKYAIGVPPVDPPPAQPPPAELTEYEYVSQAIASGDYKTALQLIAKKAWGK